MYDFTFERPAAIQDAVALLRQADAKALAGGQSFIPVLKQRLNAPASVVDLSRLALDGICRDGAGVRIGAMTTHRAVAASAEVRAMAPGLAKLAGWVGDTQVRNRGTIGGSLANNDPAACYPAAALALAATIVTDRREIPADEYFRGLFSTALAPDELITAIRIPAVEFSNYAKFRNPASRYAIVGVFVARSDAGVRVAVTGAGRGGVFRHAAMEAALNAAFSAHAIADVPCEEGDLISDIHASAAYRAHLIGVMARRALEGAR